MNKRWTLLNPDSELPILEKLLLNRGVKDRDRFLYPTLLDLHQPELLHDMDMATDMVMEYTKSRKGRITVYGDYDADGVTATAILLKTLRHLGCHVSEYIPQRSEGYGLNAKAIKEICRDSELIITVDCGIANAEEVSLARSMGADIIVTDHHQYTEVPSEANAVIHPEFGYYPFPKICGAVVAFKLAWGLLKKWYGDNLTQEAKDVLRDCMTLAAIGTVADVMPLMDENRALVQCGLDEMNTLRKRSIGINMLAEGRTEMKASDIAFLVAPKINALGRLGDPRIGVNLLTTNSEDEAREAYMQVDKLNKLRKEIQSAIYQEASMLATDMEPATVLWGDWDPGIIGITAGRMAESLGHPVILINESKRTGSGRSPNGVDLSKAMEHCREALEKGGGHPQAAGLTVKEGKLDEFRELFLRFVESQETTVPEYKIDDTLSLDQVNLGLLNIIDDIEPCGYGNHTPLFLARRVRFEDLRIMKEDHYGMKVVQDGKRVRGVAFNKVSSWDAEAMGGVLDILFEPTLNEFNGNRNAEMRLVDIRGAE